VPPEQLIASLENVATVSDEFDEQFVRKYGGETALECLRSNRVVRRTAHARGAERN
jgi:hypothetical protein